MIKRTLVTLALLALPALAAAQPAVFVVRHAERADAGMAGGSTADPDLSEAGRARAESLATVLKDARIGEIYVTELKRTQQTAAPLAKLLGIQPSIVAAKDTAGLAAKLKAASGNVLVVGHSNTVPAIVKSLGVDEPAPIADTDFGNLFVVIRGATPSLVRLHFR